MSQLDALTIGKRSYPILLLLSTLMGTPVPLGDLPHRANAGHGRRGALTTVAERPKQ
jgi:hypothetical protein